MVALGSLNEMVTKLVQFVMALESPIVVPPIIIVVTSEHKEVALVVSVSFVEILLEVRLQCLVSLALMGYLVMKSNSKEQEVLSSKLVVGRSKLDVAKNPLQSPAALVVKLEVVPLRVVREHRKAASLLIEWLGLREMVSVIVQLVKASVVVKLELLEEVAREQR